MKIFIYAPIIALTIAQTGFAQELAVGGNISMHSESRSGQFSILDANPAATEFGNLWVKEQFPAQLIPARNAVDSSNEMIQFTSLSVAGEVDQGSKSTTDSAEFPDNPPIVVNGPRLPAPKPKLDNPTERIRKVRREVARLEVAYHILSIADGIATVSCVKRRTCREVNPLIGSRPSFLRMFGVKALGGLIFHRSLQGLARKDPYKARTIGRMMVAVQATVTGMAMSVSFR